MAVQSEQNEESELDQSKIGDGSRLLEQSLAASSQSLMSQSSVMDCSKISSSRPDELETGGDTTDLAEDSKLGDSCVGDESVMSPAASDDSEWEDQETSDDDANSKLTIDEQQDGANSQDQDKDSKDDRSKIPENILRECRKFISLDKKLDKKARKNNMTSKQVKLVLKHIFSSEQIIAMLRDKGLLTTSSKQDEDIEAAEPKMTRSVTRTLTEAGDICPWIINPATPVKEPPPEIVSLVTEDFPEDEEGDPEYTPEIEPRQSDEDDSMMETSEAGTPNTHISRSTVNTPRSEFDSPAAFKIPGASTAITPRTNSHHISPRNKDVSRNLQFENTEPETWEGYGTRSKRPLTEHKIGDLEQLLPDFEAEPDLYQNHQYIPDDPYSEFLSTLFNEPSQPDNCQQDEDQTDPEYNFPADEEENRLKDPEEHRHDRATKVSRKELAELTAELLQCGNEGIRSARESRKKAKIKKRRPVSVAGSVSSCCQENEAAVTDQQAVSQSAAALSAVSYQNNRDDDTLTDQEEDSMSSEAYSQLSSQVQQHIQQVMQMRLLASNTTELMNVAEECDQMLAQIKHKSLVNPASVMNQSNLNPSVDVIKRWTEKNLQSTRTKRRIDTARKCDQVRSKPWKKSISKELATFLIQEPVILYPELLTLSQVYTNPTKTVWTKSEDMLIAQGLDWIHMQNASNTGSSERKKFLSKISMVDLAKTLSIKRLPAKTADQIYVKMKNIRKETYLEVPDIGPEVKHDVNPVLQFLNTGTLPKVYPLSTESRCYPAPTINEMVLAGYRDLPNAYVDCALKQSRPLKHFRSVSTGRLKKIEPKELIEVEPDIATDSDISSDSDEEEVVLAKRRRTQQQTLKTISPKISPVKMKNRYRPLLPTDLDTSGGGADVRCGEPRSRVTNSTTSLRSISCRLEMNITRGATVTSSTPFSHLPGLRNVLCVDGNETPVSLSESETPMQANQRTPPQETVDSEVQGKSSLSTVLTRPVFRSPEKTNSKVFLSPKKSPLKSPLKSLTNTYHRSPLKAASDRIIRKYTSPLKRKRSRGAPITPKRLLLMGGGDESVKSPRTPTSTSREVLTSPRSGGAAAGDTELDTPTGLARRKSRVQREAEATALLLTDNLETTEEKEAREHRETQELFAAIQGVLADRPELETRYEEIMGSASEQGVRETYLQLHELMSDDLEVQEHLLDLLTEEDALALGMDTYSAYSDRARFKRFLCKLNIVYRQQPAYLIKVLKELETLSKDPTLTSERLKEISCQLFRNNQHLMEEFQMLIPGIPPPQSMLPSPEILVLPEEGEEEEEGGGAGQHMEHMFVPRSPDPHPETNSANVRFSGGRCYVMDGKMLKPASIDKVPM